MVELEARATELEKNLEQSASQARVSDFIYSLLYDVAQVLKQRLATGVFCDEEMEQQLINACKDVSGYVDVLYLKAVPSQNAVMESFHGSFKTLG